MTRSPRWRGALASAASAAVLLAAPLVGAQTAHAEPGPYPPPYPAPYPPRPPALTLTATTVHAGDRLGFRGTGFVPRQRVDAVLRSVVVVLGKFRADEHGVVTGTVTIPRRTSPGLHTFKLIGRDPERRASARIRVLRPKHRADLNGPDDGQPTSAGPADESGRTALAGGSAAAGLVSLGGGTMLAMRRRRSRSS
ncbi:hypothetical protein ABZX30_35570 [Streptomyces sp. NPDC004542]|uniref:hypothetical protein n=1 Tax=Streptomyces sp. NPDC004542 TaxID=3154281 RepID=UPI00339FB911